MTGGPAMIIAGVSGCTDLPRAGPKLDVGSTAPGEQDLAAPGSARSLEVPLAAGIMRGHGRGGTHPGRVNNLPGDERDAGWDAGEEHERAR
jgi:hypothetical protein